MPSCLMFISNFKLCHQKAANDSSSAIDVTIDKTPTWASKLSAENDTLCNQLSMLQYLFGYLKAYQYRGAELVDIGVKHDDLS